MGRIVVTEFVTLDGVMEDPGGAEKTPFGGWAFKADRGEAGNQFKFEELMAADAQLLGRVTYEGFAAAWPKMRNDEFGEKMNSMPKYVFTNTLSQADWEGSHILSGEFVSEVSKLRDQFDNILVAGSATLVHALTEHDLVDEYRLMVYPIIAGQGKRLFEENGKRVDLQLTDARQSAEVTLLTYSAVRS